MKSAPLPAGGYRNEAVFRSAQRLLSSRPDDSSRVVTRAHWPLFAAGVGLGLVVALAVVLRVAREPVKIGPAVIGTAFVAPRRAGPMAEARKVARPDTSEPATLPPPAVVTPVAEIVPSAPIAEPAFAPVTRVPDALPSPARASAPAAAADPVAVQAALFAVLSDLSLRGELQAQNRAPVSVALSLRRFGTAREIAGRLEFFEKGKVIETRTVQGTLQDRTLTLQEVGPYAWNPAVPFGHRFHLTLPSKGAGGDVRGDWRLLNTRGTTILTIALPW